VYLLVADLPAGKKQYKQAEQTLRALLSQLPPPADSDLARIVQPRLDAVRKQAQSSPPASKPSKKPGG